MADGWEDWKWWKRRNELFREKLREMFGEKSKVVRKNRDELFREIDELFREMLRETSKVVRLPPIDPRRYYKYIYIPDGFAYRLRDEEPKLFYDEIELEDEILVVVDKYFRELPSLRLEGHILRMESGEGTDVLYVRHGAPQYEIDYENCYYKNRTLVIRLKARNSK